MGPRLDQNPGPHLYDWVSTYSPIAQLVERLTVNQLVPGSSPGRGAKFEKPAMCGLFLLATEDDRQAVGGFSGHRGFYDTNLPAGTKYGCIA